MAALAFGFVYNEFERSLFSPSAGADVKQVTWIIHR
jgi:hypothetical protein